MTRGNEQSVGTTRLRVLNSLPQRHQEYFFEEIRKLCANYTGSLGIPLSDRESETLELLSEVMAKLVGVPGSDTDATPVGDDSGVCSASEVHADPRRDGRVAWLLAEAGGRTALAHRREDMRRRQHGRWRDGGYRVDQLDEHHVDHVSVEPDEPHDDDDNRKVWRGVLALAGAEFKPGEDVSVLLDLMANEPDIQAEFGSRWPVSAIVARLNRRRSNPAWTDDRVENAKKRLTGWIDRIRRDSGLDAIDLMALFARYANVGQTGGARS